MFLYVVIANTYSQGENKEAEGGSKRSSLCRWNSHYFLPV